VRLAWTGRELDVRRDGVVAQLLGHPFPPEQCSQQGECLIEALPALLERDAENPVVTFGGAWAQGGDQAPSGEDVDRGQRLGQRNRAAKDGERDRRCQRQLARAFDHARERCQPVEPGCLEDEMVVRRNS
jgi:hypothetical protein